MIFFFAVTARAEFLLRFCARWLARRQGGGGVGKIARSIRGRRRVLRQPERACVWRWCRLGVDTTVPPDRCFHTSRASALRCHASELSAACLSLTAPWVSVWPPPPPNTSLSSAFLCCRRFTPPVPQGLQPGAEVSNKTGEEAAAGGSEEEQDTGDSDSRGPLMGLLLGSDPQSEENSTAAGVGAVAWKSGKQGARASVANGILVDAGTVHSTNGPTDAAASSSPGQNLRNGLSNGDIGPTASSGTDLRSDGNVNNSGGSSNRADGEAGKKRGVEVSADNVWEAFLATRPSLSSEDRARYDSAYRKFRGGSRPADFNPISSVDDGTVRTALK